VTVLGPLPDHAARALRGEPQEPQAAPREECAADSSAYLPPGGCEIDREYTRERVDQATPEQLAAAMRLTSVDNARALQAELREVGAVIVFVTQWEGFDQTLTIYGGKDYDVARVLDRHLLSRVLMQWMRGHVQCFVQGRRVRFSRPAPEHVDDDVRRAAGERWGLSCVQVHDELVLSEQQVSEAMARAEAIREKIESIIREQADTIAFDLAGLDAIAKGIEKQWALGIDYASCPSRTVVAAVDISAARAVQVPVTISTVDTRAEQHERAYAQRRIKTNYATLNGGHVITHPADEDRWTVSFARDVIDEELRKVGAELFILYRHASGHEAVVEGGTNADVAEALRRAITRSHVALTLIGTTLVGDTNTDAIEFSRPGKSLGCRDPSASLSFGGGSGLLTPEMKDALEQRGRTISQGPNHQQLPPRVSLTGTKTPNIRTFMHELSDDERASIDKQIADALSEGVEQARRDAIHYLRSSERELSAKERPNTVTVSGDMFDALGFVSDEGRNVTRSRCPDCNDTGVLAGFGFGTSENACDRPCPCSPPKNDGPSEWTQTRGRQVGADYHRELWTFTFRKGADERSFDVMAMHGLGTCVTVAGQADRCVVRINGEHCVDMAIARLLCGLRDGSITP